MGGTDEFLSETHARSTIPLDEFIASARDLEVRVAALSDFHIGVSDRRDGFRHDAGEFSRFLDGLEATHDLIVLLGDIYQTDHGVCPRSRASHLHRARRRVPRLVRRFDAAPYVHVFGNHDEIAGRELLAPEQLCLTDDGIGMVFIHGHQFDPVAGRAKWAADCGTWITGRMRAVGLRPLAEWFEARDIGIKGARFSGQTGPYVVAGRRLACAQGAQVVVMGHTHIASITKVPEGLVVNTGSCSRTQFEHVSIDTREGQVTLHKGASIASVSLHR
jgi:predicted phosphodiesterase